MKSLVFTGEVEVDEIAVYKEKPGYPFARGYQIKVWFIGIRERGSKRFVIFHVIERNRQTLLTIILICSSKQNNIHRLLVYMY